MKNWTLYRLLLRAIPPRGAVNASDLPQAKEEKVVRVLRRHRCLGASVCLFDEIDRIGVWHSCILLNEPGEGV